MKNNYSVYQHVTPDGMYYFGQTQNVEKRWSNNGIQYKGTSLYPYIEQYGWDNIQHIVLFRDQTKEDALWIEDFLITTAREDGVCINKNRSGLVSKEDGYNKNQSKQYYEKNKDKKKQYYETNKDSIREYQQEYCQKTKDKKQDYDKQYYEKNKDKKKQYYETNKDKIQEQKKQYYEQNKDKFKEYYERNKEKIKEYQEQNKDKIREYQREYRQRKKLEKQLKEAVETTLF